MATAAASWGNRWAETLGKDPTRGLAGGVVPSPAFLTAAGHMVDITQEPPEAGSPQLVQGPVWPAQGQCFVPPEVAHGICQVNLVGTPARCLP